MPLGACERVSGGPLGTCAQVKDIAVLVVGDPTELVRADVYGHRFPAYRARSPCRCTAKSDGAARHLHGTTSAPVVALASPPANPHTLVHTPAGRRRSAAEVLRSSDQATAL